MKSYYKYGRILFSLAIIFYCSNIEASNSGLIIEDYKNIHAVVEVMQKHGKKIPLSKDLVRSKVILQLQRNGLMPVEKRKAGFLYVRVNFFEEKFEIYISFRRHDTLNAGAKVYNADGDVWLAGFKGPHLNDTSYVLKHLEYHLDKFITTYVEDNENAVSFSP